MRLKLVLKRGASRERLLERTILAAGWSTCICFRMVAPSLVMVTSPFSSWIWNKQRNSTCFRDVCISWSKVRWGRGQNLFTDHLVHAFGPQARSDRICNSCQTSRWCVSTVTVISSTSMFPQAWRTTNQYKHLLILRLGLFFLVFTANVAEY